MKSKEKEKKQKKSKQKGITLIALVITIIVLLILAGVSIASLTGDNGILKRADTSREETNKQSVQEQVQVEVIESIGKKRKSGYRKFKQKSKKCTRTKI